MKLHMSVHAQLHRQAQNWGREARQIKPAGSPQLGVTGLRIPKGPVTTKTGPNQHLQPEGFLGRLGSPITSVFMPALNQHPPS